MKRALLLLLALLTLIAAGCGGGDDDKQETSSAGSLEAKLFDTNADDVVAGSAGVFALDGTDLSRIDPKTGEAVNAEPIDIESLNARVAIGENMAWVTSEGEANQVPLSGAQIRGLKVPGDGASLVVAEGKRAWILVGRQLMSLEESGRGELIDLPCEPEQLSVSDRTVWGTCARGLVRVDARKATTSVVDVGGHPSAVAATPNTTWALVEDQLVGVTPAGERGPSAKAPAGAKSLAGQANLLWVVSGTDDSKSQTVTSYEALQGKTAGGPVELPGGTDDVGAAAGSVAPFGNNLWFTLAFYGGPLGVVESEND